MRGNHPARWLSRQARTRADSLALRAGKTQLTHAQLEERVARLSLALVRQTDAQVIGLACADGLSLVLIWLACMRLGRALLPLGDDLPPEQWGPLLAGAGCDCLLSDRPVAGLPGGVTRLPLEGLPVRASGEKGAAPAPEPSTDAISLIVPTSGSSGEPKGVMLSAASLAASAAAVSRRLQLGPGDCWLNCLPLNHVGGLAIPLRCLYAGALLWLEPPFDARRVWGGLSGGLPERSARLPSHLSLVPAMLERLLEVSRDAPAPAQLRRVLIGGGPLSPQLARRAHAAGWPLVVSYGMSETGSLCVLDDSPGAGQEAGVVGWPLEGFELALGTAGEIRLRGPALMSGYANPRLLPGDGLAAGWFPSGDLGAWDDQGRLRLLGRADDQLNTAGVRLHPQAVEARLLECPGVREVGVSGRPDPVWGERLVALYVGGIEPQALREWVREQLPKALRPREFRRVAALPRGRLGKLNRRRLRECIASAAGAGAQAAPGAAAPPDRA